MKVLALGGSGGMGRYAVQSLYKHSKIKKIYVADINADAAKDFFFRLFCRHYFFP